MDLSWINRLRARIFARIDLPLLAISLALMAFGLATVFSAFT